MKGKLFTIICWFFYFGLMYTALYPDHAYLDILHSARTLYLIVHVPLTIVAIILVLGLNFSKSTIINTIDEVKNKTLENRKNIEKFQESYKRLTKLNIFLFINRIIYYPASIITLIILKDYFLGGVMLTGIVTGAILFEQSRYIANEVNKELKNANN